MRTPRASRTSAAPQLPEAARLPCLAMRTPRAGGDEGGGGGYVEGAGAVAAGADGVDDRAFDADLEGELAHERWPCPAISSVGLALEAQGGEEGAELGGRGLAPASPGA